jgi:hypothetical protein
MSYAVLARRIAYGAFGDVQATITANVSASADTLKEQARQTAIAEGIPGEAFDALNSLAYGADSKVVLGNLAKTGALKLVQSVSSQQVSDATGLPTGVVDAARDIASGATVDPVAMSQIVGAAVGTAVCGPACGAVVGFIAGSVAGGIKAQLDEPAQQQARADKMAAIATAQADLFAIYIALEQETDVAMRFGVAKVYNQALALGFIPQYPLGADGTTADEQAALDKALGLFGSSDTFAQAHGGQSITQAVLLVPRQQFIQQVSSAVNSRYGGMWDRDQAESGYRAVLPYMLGNKPDQIVEYEDGTSSNYGPPHDFSIGDPNYVFPCHPYNDLGYPPPGEISENPRTAAWAVPVFKCRCQYHAKWFAAALASAARTWGRISSRSAAIWQLQDQMAKQKQMQQQIQAATNAAVNQVQLLAARTMQQLAAAKVQITMANLVSAQTAQRNAFMGAKISKTALALIIGGAGIAAAIWYWFEEAPQAAAAS